MKWSYSFPGLSGNVETTPVRHPLQLGPNAQQCIHTMLIFEGRMHRSTKTRACLQLVLPSHTTHPSKEGEDNSDPRSTGDASSRASERNGGRCERGGEVREDIDIRALELFDTRKRMI